MNGPGKFGKQALSVGPLVIQQRRSCAQVEHVLQLLELGAAVTKEVLGSAQDVAARMPNFTRLPELALDLC
jgi:hypothetical protein